MVLELLSGLCCGIRQIINFSVSRSLNLRYVGHRQEFKRPSAALWETSKIGLKEILAFISGEIEKNYIIMTMNITLKFPLISILIWSLNNYICSSYQIHYNEN